jgi:hypothetical protein
MARKFFYICVGLLLAMAARSTAAQTVTLYTVSYLPSFTSYSLGTFGFFQGAQAPSALLFGHVPSPGAAVSEVAVEQRVLHPGDAVPLPKYADGTDAKESEVFWTVHLWQARFGDAYGVNIRWDQYHPAADNNYGGDVVTVTFDGLTYGGGSGRLAPGTEPANVATNVDVMVTVIATRLMSATPTKATSWGQLKTRFAPNGGTVSKGAEIR